MDDSYEFVGGPLCGTSAEMQEDLSIGARIKIINYILFERIQDHRLNVPYVPWCTYEVREFNKLAYVNSYYEGKYTYDD